jgi:hypothetical protein
MKRLELDIQALPATRRQAIDAGSRHFFTGKPCKRGHLSPRLTSSLDCCECHRARVLSSYNADPEPQKTRSMARYNKRRQECPDVVREEGRIRQANWKRNNPEHVRKMDAQYRETNRERLNQLARDRYAQEPERHRAKTRRNRKPEVSARGFREWCKNNPEKVRARDQTKRARRKGAEGKFSPSDIQIIRKAQKDKCAYCRADLKGKGTVDHIKALVNGGSNLPNNLQLVCHSCNSRKRAKDPIVFAQELGRLL